MYPHISQEKMNLQEVERQEIRDIIMCGPSDFEAVAFRIFQYQYAYNELYQSFCRHIGRTPTNVRELTDIPFLPIQFFKTHHIRTGNFDVELIFKSSGTTRRDRSQHLVRDSALYQTVSRRIFERNYGALEDYTILALLPSYLEQGESSLVYMVHSFMDRAGDASGFYLHDFERLADDLTRFRLEGRHIILWGVTYALLDFAEKHPVEKSEGFQNDVPVTLLETGGMKGRREELLRSEVHQLLNEAFHCGAVHSEYGMTELLSQAYSAGDGIFTMNNTMRIMASDVMDPLTFLGDGVTGACHVIDLANIDSCSFIATQDLCRTSKDTFEILGRLDHSDIRGCNLLYEG